MPARIACIVEGEGELESVPALIHRICRANRVAPPILPRPFRVGRHRLIKPGAAERAVRLAVKYAGPSGGVLMLLDADDDCAATMGSSLLDRVRKVLPETGISVTLACREF